MYSAKSQKKGSALKFPAFGLRTFEIEHTLKNPRSRPRSQSQMSVLGRPVQKNQKRQDVVIGCEFRDASSTSRSGIGACFRVTATSHMPCVTNYRLMGDFLIGVWGLVRSAFFAREGWHVPSAIWGCRIVQMRLGL